MQDSYFKFNLPPSDLALLRAAGIMPIAGGADGDETPAGDAPAAAPAAKAKPPAPDAPVEGQQTPSPDAAATAPTEGQPDAPVEGEKPAQDKAPELTADDFAALDDEAQDALIDAFGAQLAKRPGFEKLVQSRIDQGVDKRMRELQADPENDPEYQQLTAQAGEYMTQVDAMLQQLEKGDKVDPKGLAGGVVNVQTWAHATAERGQFRQLLAAADRVAADNLGELAADHPLNVEYQEALQNYQRERNAMTKERKPDAKARVAALPRLTERIVQIMFKAGEQSGTIKTAKGAEKATGAKVTLAKNASFNEALAKLAARRGGQAAAEAAGGGRAASSFNTLAELTKAHEAGTDGLTGEQFIAEQDRLLAKG